MTLEHFRRWDILHNFSYLIRYFQQQSYFSAEEDEPSPGDVVNFEECRLWAELWTDDGAKFFHYNSTSEECRLYRTLLAECQAVGGPKEAPSFDQCEAATTESTTGTFRVKK